MAFAVDETQQMISDSVGRLLASENEFNQRRARLAASPPQRLALWPQLAETGMIGSGFPEAIGGFGTSARDVAVVQYAVGRNLAVEPYLGVVVAGRILQAAASDRARTEIERMIAGERIIVLAHAEGFDPLAGPGARASGDPVAGWNLTGLKPVVRHADVAHALVVTAKLPEGEWGCFLVEREQAEIETLRLIDAAGAGTLTLQDTPGVLLLAGQAAVDATTDAVEWAILGAAAEAVGIFDALNAATREYLRTRVQFGVPIGSFQALQHRSADMFIAGEEARVSTDAVLDTVDADAATLGRAARSQRVSALKAVIDRAGLRIGHEAVQMHGGVGVSDELAVSHYLRRLAAMRAEWGGGDLHRERYRALAA